MKFIRNLYSNSLVSKLRTRVREHGWQQAVRGMLRLLQHYPLLGLALLNEWRIERRRLAQELRACKHQVETLRGRLRKQRQRIEHLKNHNQRLTVQRQNSNQTIHVGQDLTEDEHSLPVGGVNLGDLRRVRPISRNFGLSRGRPIDRYYIEKFLACHADDIRGRVLEIRDASYTRRFGGDRVSSSDVLDVSKDNQRATIVADLTHANHHLSNSFDCVIFTQTLQFIYDIRSAVETLHRILKPGGTLLATFPGITQISCRQYDEHWFWALTHLSARRLFEEAFSTENIRVEAYGNVLAATAFLQGLAVKELRQEELDHHDPDYEVLIALRAVKSEVSS